MKLVHRLHFFLLAISIYHYFNDICNIHVKHKNSKCFQIENFFLRQIYKESNICWIYCAWVDFNSQALTRQDAHLDIQQIDAGLHSTHFYSTYILWTVFTTPKPHSTSRFYCWTSTYCRRLQLSFLSESSYESEHQERRYSKEFISRFAVCWFRQFDEKKLKRQRWQCHTITSQKVFICVSVSQYVCTNTVKASHIILPHIFRASTTSYSALAPLFCMSLHIQTLSITSRKRCMSNVYVYK